MQEADPKNTYLLDTQICKKKVYLCKFNSVLKVNEIGDS